MTWTEGFSLFGFMVGAALTIWLVEKQRRTTHAVSPGYQQEIELPHEENFELYHNALSLCSMKTRLCLAELAIPYKSHHVDLIETGCYENIRPRLLAVNPGGTVPVLVHRGHPIYESHEQIRYAAKFASEGAPLLIPDDPNQRQEMEEWIDRSSLTDDPLANADKTAGNAVPGLTLPLFFTMVEKIPLMRIAEGLFFHFDKMRPMMFILFKLRGIENLAKMSPAVKVIAKSRREMGIHLDALEAQLVKSGGPWILGEMYTLADVGWLVILERLRQADAEAAFFGKGKRPRVERYWERLKSRPAYREAILDQSHPAIEYGTRRIKEARAASAPLRECLDGKDED